MSSKSYDKNYRDMIRQVKDIKIENALDLRKVMIPFSKISNKQRQEYIYLGHEKILFSSRHPVYQLIFRNEFGDAIKSINKRNSFISGSTNFSTSF